MKKAVVIFLVLCSVLVNAQQTGMYSHFFYKPMLYNPAFAGMGGNINVMAINRTQFTGFSGAPVSNIFTLDGKIPSKKIGLGLTITSNQQGLTSNIGANILYSYSLHLSTHTRLAFGVSLGAMNYSFNFSRAIVENNNDPQLSTSTQNTLTINGNAGIALYGRNFEFGISAPQILAPNVKYTTESGTSAYFQQTHQYIGYYKYKYFISKQKNISLCPFLLVDMVPNTPLQINVGANFDWKNKFWVGTIYKSGYAVSSIVGFRLYNQFDLGYSYDFVLGNLSKYSGIANEIMLSYTFGKGKHAQQKDSTAKDSSATLKMSDLNSILLKKLLAEVDALFDNPNATIEDYKALGDKISQFSDSFEGDDSMKKLLLDYVEKLSEEKKEEAPHVTVKGQISFSGNKKSKEKPDFSNISIRLMDKESGVEIGNYLPKARNGKYILILKPGEKYIVKVEKEGYQTFTKEMAPAVKKKSYEVKQVIKLKKIKVVKPKSTTKKQ